MGGRGRGKEKGFGKGRGGKQKVMGGRGKEGRVDLQLGSLDQPVRVRARADSNIRYTLNH